MAGSENPFSLFFSSEDEIKTARETSERQNQELSNTLTRIFLVVGKGSDGSNCPKHIIRLSQFEENEGPTLNMDNYEKALAERVQMASPELNLVSNKRGITHGLYEKEKATEKSKISYLCQCYSRAMAEKIEEKNRSWKIQVVTTCKDKISQMAGMMACTSHNMIVLQAQNPSESDFVRLLMSTIEVSSSSLDFFKQIAEKQTPSNLNVIFGPVLNTIYKSCANLTLSSPNLHIMINAVLFFCQNKPLAQLLVDSRFWRPDPKMLRNGKSFETHTLLGRLLQPTTMAASLIQPAEYFADIEPPFHADVVNSVTTSLQVQLESLVSKLKNIFSCLLRQGEEPKGKVIKWLVECFSLNADRGKMLSRLQGVNPNLTTASDGFFLNLSWVLLHLCTPFMTIEGGINPRLKNVDPGYCVIPTRKRRREGSDEESVDEATYRGQLIDFSQETKITLDRSEGGSSPSTVSPVLPIKFVTHCFFLTHKCILLGITQTIHLFNDLLRAYSRVRRMNLLGGPVRLLQSQILGIKAHATHPQLLELCLTFYTATSIWLVELVKQDRQELFPLPQQTPATLQNIPECLVENLADFAMFLKHSGLDTLDNSSDEQKHLITFCTVFIGNSQLLHNPHLRAKLTQLLSLMIPQEEDETQQTIQPSVEIKKLLFESHPIACGHLVESLLTIFIDIEHTGDSMEFEDKFQYRIPMYDILEFLWSLPAYKPSIIKLSQQAESGQMSSITPVFLRFINMMINDAIVQLDEGLQNLKTIKEIQDLKDSNEWERLTGEEKKQNDEKLDEASMYASNRNLLSMKTVHTLEIITNDITKPFVTMTMVDRMAAMLNYFLKELVGPESKEFIVKNREKYNFDPRELVSGIIAVYINLSEEPEFCQAIPRDGRSFSMDLFDMALNVLRRLGKSHEYVGLERMRVKVKQYHEKQIMEEEILDDAPEEFIDPIMGTVMTDPVILPSSGNTVDRSTIVRHLLSEQYDPYNREPLTVDMLIPNNELKQRINEWKQQPQKGGVN